MLGTWAHTCTFLDRQVHCFTQTLRTSKSLLLMEQHLPQRPNMSASNRYQYLFYCDVHVSVNVCLHSTVWFHVHSYMLIVLDDDVEREGLGRNCEKRDAGGTVRKQLLWGGWGDRRVTEELKERKKAAAAEKIQHLSVSGNLFQRVGAALWNDLAWSAFCLCSHWIPRWLVCTDWRGAERTRWIVWGNRFL